MPVGDSLSNTWSYIHRNDYKDLGWYKHPAGTVAYEFEGSVPDATNRHGEAAPGPADIEVTAVKPEMNPRKFGQH